MTSGACVFLIMVICLLSSSSGQPYEFLQKVEQCQNVSMCNGTKHQFEDLTYYQIRTLECPCYACSCLQNCSLYGNCCPDRVQPDIVPQYTCFPFYIKFTDYLETVDQRGALVMTRCPENTLHPREAKKCHSSTDPFDITNPPVTSLSDQVDYRNKHCARCNGVSNYSSWSVHLQCNSNQYLNLGNGTLIPGCQAYYNAPTKSYLPCYYKPINTCNVTGYWQSPDPMLAEGCATAPRQNYDVGASIIYHNAYCIFCNVNPRLYPRSVRACYPAGPRVPFTRSLLLNFNTADDEEEEIICPTRYMFDPHKNSCRYVICPLSSEFSSCECLSQNNSTTEAIVLSIGFTPDTDIYLDVSGTSSVEAISKYLWSLFRLRHESHSLFPGARSIYLSFIFNKTIGGNSTEGKLENIYALIRLVTFSNTYNNDTAQGLLSLYVDPIFFPEWNATLYPRYDPMGSLLELYGRIDRKCHDLEILPTNKCGLFTNEAFSKLPRASFKIINLHKDLTPLTYNCPSISLPRAEYETQDKYNSIRIIATDKKLPSHRFNLNSDDSVTVCLHDYIRCNHGSTLVADSKPIEEILSYVSVCSSLLCLVLTLFTYARFEVLRNFPGRINALCAGSLFAAQLVFIAGVQRTEYQLVCKILGILIHYLYLFHIFAMNVCSIHMFRVFSKVMKPTENNKVFLKYLFYACLCPLLIVGATVTGSYVVSSVIDYGGDACFISRPFTVGLSLVLPCMMMVGVNVLLYILTVVNLSSSAKSERAAHPNRQLTTVYIKLSSVTGATWLLALFAELFDNDILRYLFTVVNGSQGVFIFIVFVCNKRVLNIYRSFYLTKSD